MNAADIKKNIWIFINWSMQQKKILLWKISKSIFLNQWIVRRVVDWIQLFGWVLYFLAHNTWSIFTHVMLQWRSTKKVLKCSFFLPLIPSSKEPELWSTDFCSVKNYIGFFFQPKVFYFIFFYSHSCFFLSKFVFSLHFFLLINLLWQNVMKRILFLSVAEMSSSGAARKRHLLTKCENCHHVVVTSQLTVLACLAHYYHTTHTSHVWIFTFAFEQPTKSTK